MIRESVLMFLGLMFLGTEQEKHLPSGVLFCSVPKNINAV